MKSIVISSAVLLGLVVTNPNQNSYSEFIAKHAKRKLCEMEQVNSSWRPICKMIAGPVAKTVIYQTTERTNLVLFSLYSTDLQLKKIEVVGIGGLFIPLPE